ncbi:unnamed protein product [Leptosia nina]|uniref:Uncharacterized protein n=1 Tax=Leptosia nina TaxID=320188 RepID=A0AAV1JNB4_9NEOP
MLGSEGGIEPGTFSSVRRDSRNFFHLMSVVRVQSGIHVTIRSDRQMGLEFPRVPAGACDCFTVYPTVLRVAYGRGKAFKSHVIRYR